MIKASSAKRFPAEHFLNRELSLLAFNRRVLGQAADAGVPLLERLRFLCIVSSNLDEFFEIRVAGLKEQIKLGAVAPAPTASRPHEAFRRVSRRGARADRGAVRPAQRRHPAGAGETGHPLPQAQRRGPRRSGLDPAIISSAR
jgi:polyphosphate kinase